VSAHKNQPFACRLRFAAAGLLYGLVAERSLRLQVAVFGLVVIALLVLEPGALWWALVMVASAAVLGAELLNTALERLTDHLHPDVHPQIRIVKDCAAGAVLLSVLGAIGVAIALAVHLLSGR